MNKNKFSICIPYFNEANQIVNLTNDILNLDLNSQDLIINYIFIDDCSNDDTTIKLKNILQYNNEEKQRVYIVRGGEGVCMEDSSFCDYSTYYFFNAPNIWSSTFMPTLTQNL